MRRPIICLTLGFMMISAPAQAQVADTIYTNHSFLDAKDLWLAGGFVVATALAAPADKWITHELQDEARQANRRLQSVSTGARVWGNPGTLIAGGGLYLVGTAAGSRRVQDMGLHATGAVIVANLITGGIKTVAGRARPYVDSSNARNFHLMRGLHESDYRSFPSGHATAAFAFASVVTAETSRSWPDARWPVGIVTYGMASLTGLSRIYNYKHWASDVVAGTAIGTLTGLKLYRYQHSHPGNRIDKTLLRAGLQSSGGNWSLIFAAVPR